MQVLPNSDPVMRFIVALETSMPASSLLPVLCGRHLDKDDVEVLSGVIFYHYVGSVFSVCVVATLLVQFLF